MADKKQMVTAVFRDRYNAERAFEMLRSRGLLDSEINVLMSDRTRKDYLADAEHEDRITAGNMAAAGTAVGGAVGTAVGAALGAIAAIGTTLLVPGLGLVIAGPIAAALAGAGAGAVTGGLVGLLVGWGIPEDNAKAYQEALKTGGVIIGVTPRSGKEASEIKQAFEEMQAEDIVTNVV